MIAGGLVATPVFAQGSAVITGTVVDASTKNPVADVVVTATSPRMQGEQVVVTDASGVYRIPQLPSGVYTVRYEKESYRPFARDGITIRQDVTVRVNIDLLPDSIQEDIVVIGRPPTIDVGSTTTGINVSSDFIKNIAVVNPGGRGGAARSFEALATIAPGAHADAYGVSINGTTSPENQYLIDGVSVNDPGFGINATPLTVDFVSEVNVITGGYLPEYGRATGGVMSVVTKSGSNEFHGSVFANVTPGVTQGDFVNCADNGGWATNFNCGRVVQRTAQTINTDERLWNLGDVGVEVGGPIMKDKLWFFAGFAPSYTRNLLTRTLRARVPNTNGIGYQTDASGAILTQEIPNNTNQYFSDQSTYQYIGKLTYLINQDHNISVSVYGTPTSSGGQNEFGIDPRTGQSEVGNIVGSVDTISTRYFSNSLDVSAKLASSFMDKKLLLDVSLGYHNQQNTNTPYDGSAVGSNDGLAGIPQVSWVQPGAGRFWPLGYYETLNAEAQAACGTDRRASLAPTGANATNPEAYPACPTTGYVTGGSGFISDLAYNRFQGKGIVTYLLNAAGHHVLKAGIDIEGTTMDSTRAYTGDTYYRSRGAGNRLRPSLWDEIRAYAILTGPDDINYFDSLRHVSSSITYGGFVQDSWNLLDLVTLNLGVRYDAQTMMEDGGGVALNLGNQISPRIGLIYDFTGSGRSKLYANYARYYENAVLNMIDRGFPAGEPGLFLLRSAALCDPSNTDQTTNGCRDSASLFGPLANPDDPNQYVIAFGDERTLVDPEILPQSSDEIVVGGEYEVFQDARAGVTYTKRYMVNVIEDVSLDEAATYILTNPGRAGTLGEAFPAATRDYDNVTVYLNKNFSDLWLAQVSYTWSRLTGNYAGLFRPETGQLDPNINATFDLISLLTNATGPLPGDRTHSLKAFAAKEFVFGGNMSVNLGLTYTARSGTKLNVFGRHEIYGNDEVFILPRGSGGELPWQHNVDSHLAFNYKLSKDSMVTLSADVFNLFNFQREVGRDQRYTTSTVQPIVDGTEADLETLLTVTGAPVIVNPNFGRTSAYQAPRGIRFGARVSF